MQRQFQVMASALQNDYKAFVPVLAQVVAITSGMHKIMGGAPPQHQQCSA